MTITNNERQCCQWEATLYVVKLDNGTKIAIDDDGTIYNQATAMIKRMDCKHLESCVSKHIECLWLEELKGDEEKYAKIITALVAAKVLGDE